ncbi:hypothetical protein [Larkinella soli]|uniref:hypothetical protein n=1 Tax=Larkinella soli TaxID=1770527 RepID=UPI000FFC29C8|nr:hypothetical protein [Larkinella soli]
MKKVLLSLLALVCLTAACKKDADTIDPAIQSKTPEEAVGKWMYGTFSMSNFWTYDGKYGGKPYEQALVLDFKANGTYEQYIINAVTSYNCKTEAFTYMKGKVKFDEEAGTFTLTPTEGNYRGFYSCYPSQNFKRDARKDELRQETFYYETDGGRGVHISTGGNQKGYYLKGTDW